MIALAVLAREFVELREPATDRAVGIMRGRARKQFADWVLPDGVAGDGLLVVTELLTNAMRHGNAREFVLRLAILEGVTLRIEVDDPTREHWPRLRPAGGGSGNGMRLVKALTDRWGVIVTRGKTVYANLPLGE